MSCDAYAAGDFQPAALVQRRCAKLVAHFQLHVCPLDRRRAETLPFSGTPVLQSLRQEGFPATKHPLSPLQFGRTRLSLFLISPPSFCFRSLRCRWRARPRTHVRRAHAEERKGSHLPLPAVSLFSANVAKCLHFCITATIKPPPLLCPGLLVLLPSAPFFPHLSFFMKPVCTSRKKLYMSFILCYSFPPSFLLISCPSLFLSLHKPPPLLLFHPSILRASSSIPSAPPLILFLSRTLLLCSVLLPSFSFFSFRLQVSVPALPSPGDACLSSSGCLVCAFCCDLAVSFSTVTSICQDEITPHPAHGARAHFLCWLKMMVTCLGKSLKQGGENVSRSQREVTFFPTRRFVHSSSYPHFLALFSYFFPCIPLSIYPPIITLPHG